MVINLRSTICLLMLGLIACPSISADEEGFLFRNQEKAAGSGSAGDDSGVPPFVLQAQLPTLGEEKPDTKTKTPAKPKAAKPEAVSKPKSNPTPRAATKPKPPGKVTLSESAIDDCCGVNGDCCETTCDRQGCYDSGCNGDCNRTDYDCCNERDFFRSGNFYIRSWIDQGATFNSESPKDRVNGPTGYNWRSNEYMMNQLYTIIGRDVKVNGCLWDAGGRVDLLYGTDYIYTQATGLETHKIGNTPRWNSPAPSGLPATYGFSMPQLYAEFAVPLAQGTTLKFGHFYSLIGYESPMAPQNFFYSHSYARVYGEPTTETGMLASSKISPNVVVHGGFSQGWDIWETPIQALSFIGGVCWSSHDDQTSVGIAIDTGHFPVQVNPPTGDDRTILSLVVSQQLGCRWTYIFQYDVGSQQNAFTDGQNQPQTANWYGINNYLFYCLSDTLSAGMRVEWFCDEDRFLVFEQAGVAGFTGTNYSELTLGLNWQPNNRITVRPEVRWDWSNVKGSAQLPFRPYNDFNSSYQFLFATDVIIRF